ncbi:hypothetical protein ACVWWN_003775 [Mycobacterium sp. URHB0021]
MPGGLKPASSVRWADPAVVTAACLVLALTMVSVVISDLLGRWFRWPVRVRTRPARRGPVPALTGVVVG